MKWYYILALIVVTYFGYHLFCKAPNDPFEIKFDAYRRKYNIPNMQVSVNEASFSYGEKFLVWGKVREPNLSRDALYRIASISKTVTATAIFYLINSGKLTLETRMMEDL